MPREHLFDIQELRDHVAQHMESRDYRQCALVCRSWQEGFQPLVWERVVVHLQSNFPVGSMGQCPPERIAAFHRNAHWIRHLSFSKYRGHCLHGELSGILAAQCRSLVSLDTTDTPENFWPFIGMLLVLNTSIERVRVKLLTSTLEYPQQLKSVLGGHSRLRQLELCVSLTAAALADILDACPSLYEVHVTQIIEGTSAYWNATGATKAQDHTLVHRPPYGLKRVMLSASCRDPAINDLILARCPSLEMLRIHSLEGLAAGKFRRLVRAGCFPKLTDFWLDCSRGDLCLKELFNDFPENQLRRVQLTWPVGDDIGACVERNHASLEEFELLRYGYVIACSIIPLLPMFRCDRLKTLTLTSGLDVRQLLTQPWSCWNLETLRLQSTNLTKDCKIQELWDAASDEKQDIAPGEPEWEQVELVLLRRIGTLINLRHLEVNLLYEPRHRVHGFAEPTPLIKSCKGHHRHTRVFRPSFSIPQPCLTGVLRSCLQDLERHPRTKSVVRRWATRRSSNAFWNLTGAFQTSCQCDSHPFSLLDILSSSGHHAFLCSHNDRDQPAASSHTFQLGPWRKLASGIALSDDEANELRLIIAKHARYIRCLTIQSLEAFRLFEHTCTRLRAFHCRLEPHRVNNQWRYWHSGRTALEIEQIKQDLSRFVKRQPDLEAINWTSGLMDLEETRALLFPILNPNDHRPWKHFDIYLEEQDYHNIGTLLPYAESARFAITNLASLHRPLDQPHFFLQELQIWASRVDPLALQAILQSFPRLRRLVIRRDIEAMPPLLDLVIDKARGSILSLGLAAMQAGKVTQLLSVVPPPLLTFDYAGHESCVFETQSVLATNTNWPTPAMCALVH